MPDDVVADNSNFICPVAALCTVAVNATEVDDVADFLNCDDTLYPVKLMTVAS